MAKEKKKVTKGISKNKFNMVIKPQKEVIVLENKTTLIISEDLRKDIDYLHLKCPGLEWSGILLYNIQEGSISTPENLLIKAERLFLMDIGTSGSTEYDYDESLLDMWEQIPDSENMKMGHIHTHHSMGIYFSETDMDELHDNAPNYNYYLSLIVGYKPGETYKAKIAIDSKKEGGRMSYSNAKGKNRWIKLPEEDVLLTIDCEVLHQESDCHDINLFNRHKEILKSKEKKKSAIISSVGLNKGIHYDRFFGYNSSSSNDITNYSIGKFISKVIACDLSSEDYLIKAIDDKERNTSKAELDIYYDIIDDKFEDYAELFFGFALTVNDLEDILVKSIQMLNTFNDRPLVEKVSNILSKKLSDMDDSFHLETTENKQLDNNLKSDRWRMF